MELFQRLLTIVSAALPLPAFGDKEAVLAWLDPLGDPLADLITLIATQLQADGFVDVILPTGEVAQIVLGLDGVARMSDEHQVRLGQALGTDDEGLPRADGKWRELFKKLLPFLLQILPFFLEPNPEPEPPIV